MPDFLTHLFNPFRVGGWVIVSGPEENRIAPSTNYGKLAEADPNLLKDYERITRIAAIIGDKEIMEEGTRELILAENSATVNAMRGTGALNISAEVGDQLIEAMSVYAYKVIGV